MSCVELAISDGIARIILNRPERLNAVSLGMHAGLNAALDAIAADGSVRVVLLTGAGRGFCAGQDLGERAFGGDEQPDLGKSLAEHYNPLVRRLTTLPVPLVCAVNGVAAGAGAGLALLADVVIAAESASFVLSFAKIGLMADCGLGWILPRLVGQARALGMALTADRISARVAADWGLIWSAVPDARFAAETERLVRAMAAGPTLGLMAAREAIRGSWCRSLDAQLDHECAAQRRLGQTDDYREGVSAFAEKREAQFQAR